MKFNELERHRLVQALTAHGYANPLLSREIAELIVKVQEHDEPRVPSATPMGVGSLYPYRLGQLEGLVESFLQRLIQKKATFAREYRALLAKWKAEDAAPARCYSDHDEDIRTKGSCDYCRGREPQPSETPR